jgi:hypothetical protein
VRPDGVLTLLRVTVGLVAAGVHDLEVVDVAVGLVEVAVAVEVVAVPLVERLQVGGDVGHGAAGCDLLGVPLVQRVLQQEPGVAADGAGARETVAAAVARLVERHLHPVGDLTVDAVAARGLLFVVLPDRLGPGHVAVAEVHVVEVRVAEVRLPDGAVVDRTIRLRNGVVQRAVEDRRTRGVRVGVHVGVARVPLVAELRQNHEDPVALLTRQLDVLVDLAARVEPPSPPDGDRA